MKRRVGVVALVLLGGVACFLAYSGPGRLLWDVATIGTSSQLQHDFDIARLTDLREIAELLEEYEAKAGHYPLVGESDVPNYVFIATAEQLSQKTGGPSYAHLVTPLPTFVAELESVLQRELELPFDPQRAMQTRPNFYIPDPPPK